MKTVGLFIVVCYSLIGFSLFSKIDVAYGSSLNPRFDEQIIYREKFIPNLDSIDPASHPDHIVIKVSSAPIPLTVSEAIELSLFSDFQGNIVESLKSLDDLEDVLDLNDILVVLNESEEPRLLSKLCEDNKLITPEEIRNPWKIVDHNKGAVFDLQSHFIKVTSDKTGKSALIPLSIAVKKGVISAKQALQEIKDDMEKEVLEHKKYILEQNANGLNQVGMKRYEKVVKFLKRPDVLPLKFTLNAYGNEIVGDFDHISQMSFGRAGEGIFVYNYSEDLNNGNEVNDGRFFIRGKYIGFSGDVAVGDALIFPWIGYRAGKLKLGLFGAVDTGFLLNSLFLGGILRIGKGELAAGIGIFVVPFRFLTLPGILLGSTVMKKKIREVEVKRSDAFKVQNKSYEIKLKDIRGKFFRFAIGLGDPLFGLGVRSRWTDEQAKDRSYQAEMEGSLARSYFADGKRINLTRFGRSTNREQLPDFMDPREWPVGTSAEFERTKNKVFLSAFGSMIIPAGVCIAKHKDTEKNIRFRVTRKKNNRIEIRFIQNIYIEKGYYGSIVEVLGKMRSKGSSQILIQKYKFDLNEPAALESYQNLINLGILPRCLDASLETYLAERNNFELLKFLQEEKSALENLGIYRSSIEWMQPNFNKNKYIMGFQLLGIPGFSGEKTRSEGPLKQIKGKGLIERDLVSSHQIKETPRARFKYSTSINSIEYMEYLNEDQELESEFHAIRSVANYNFTKVFGRKNKTNIDQLIKDLNRYMPGHIEPFLGEGKERRIETEILLEAADIERMQTSPRMAFIEKIWDQGKVGDVTRKEANAVVDLLRDSENLQQALIHIRTFLKKHPIYGMGFLALLAGKEQMDHVLTSSAVYDDPFRLADEFFLDNCNFEDNDKKYDSHLDVDHEKILNKFFKQGLYILRKIDKAFMEIQNDAFLQVKDIRIRVNDEIWEKEELQARLWLLKRQIKQFMEQLTGGNSKEYIDVISTIKAKNRDLHNKISYYEFKLDSTAENKRHDRKKMYRQKFKKYMKRLDKNRAYIEDCAEGLPAYEKKLREDEFKKIEQQLERFKGKVDALESEEKRNLA